MSVSFSSPSPPRGWMIERRWRGWSLWGRARSVLLLWAFGLAALSLWGCDAAPEGRLELSYQLASLEGAPLQCSELGAAVVEISLYHLPEDVLPYHRASGPCETTLDGEGRFEIEVDAHRYSRLEARLVTQAGSTVRFCRPPDSEEARFVLSPLVVSEGEIRSVQWRIEGTPGSCPASP